LDISKALVAEGIASEPLGKPAVTCSGARSGSASEVAAGRRIRVTSRRVRVPVATGRICSPPAATGILFEAAVRAPTSLQSGRCTSFLTQAAFGMHEY
jgi:hypothetical protein